MGMGDKVAAAPSGYSGTPLAKKLGLKNGFTVLLIDPPGNYFDLFDNIPADLVFTGDIAVKKDFIHFFTKELDAYKKALQGLKEQIKPGGIIWISWTKKSAKIVTDISENQIRDYALSIGLVDVKVCAVDEIWSGLKLVIRLKDRGL